MNISGQGQIGKKYSNITLNDAFLGAFLLFFYNPEDNLYCHDNLLDLSSLPSFSRGRVSYHGTQSPRSFRFLNNAGISLNLKAPSPSKSSGSILSNSISLLPFLKTMCSCRGR